MQILQGCAAGRGLLVLSGQEFSGISCWQEFAGALLAGTRWADLLAVVRGNSLVRGVRIRWADLLAGIFWTDVRRNRWHGFAGLRCVHDFAWLSCWQGFDRNLDPLLDTPCHSSMNLAPLREKPCNFPTGVPRS